MNADFTFPARDDDRVVLQPFNDPTRELMRRATLHVGGLSEQAEKFRAECDRIQKSKFNPYALFSAVSYSQRCDSAGNPQPDGGFYRGVELTLSSSVEEQTDCVTVDYVSVEGELNVYFGSPGGAGPTGLLVDTHSDYNRNRLEKPIRNELKMKKFEVRLEPRGEVDTVLYASKKAANPVEAMKTANALSTAYLSKCGLEAKVANLVRQRTNVTELEDENLADFVRLDDAPRDTYPNTLLITSMRVCRRCAAEFPWLLVALSKERPDLHFAVAFVDKPKLTFRRKVMMEDLGDVRTTALVTPFVLAYKEGRLQEYVATAKTEAPPGEADVRAMIDRCFGGE